MICWRTIPQRFMSSKRIRKKRMKQGGRYGYCTMCGKELDLHRQNFITGRRGLICHRCIHTSCLLMENMPISEKPGSANVLTPQELMRKLDQFIVGQEQAKRTVALAMWKQQLRASGVESVPTGHLLLYGPSGCGKTYLAAQAAKLCGLPSLVFDATSLTEAGYRGRDAADIFKDYRAANVGHPALKYGVIILDEIDKLAGKGSAERQAHFRGTQHTLLKQMEKEDELLILFCGAFSGLFEENCHRAIGFLNQPAEMHSGIVSEEFVRFGMERELVGRISAFAPIAALTEADLVCLLRKKGSVLEQYQQFFAAYAITLVLSDQHAVQFARNAIRQGTGARGMKQEIDRCMEPLLLELAAGTQRKRMELQYVRDKLV